jgi:hypothetical protein
MRSAGNVICRAVLAAALLIASIAAEAANPYKSKRFAVELARDLGIEISRVKSFKKSFCGSVTANQYESTQPKIDTVFRDCMTADLTDAFGLFVFDTKTKKWVEAATLTPDIAKGFQIAEAVSLRKTLRELVFELQSGTRVVVWYAGGLVGDHAYPLEIARRLDEIGFGRLTSARYVDSRITGQTIYLYR